MSPRGLAAAVLVAATAVAPFAQPASALCQGVSVKSAASAGYCDEYADYWVWCAGVGVAAAGGVSACQYESRTGLWVGCWTPSGLRCN